eukprot:PhF_6_TR42137/c0_g1_i1/m.63647/K10770/ALKBH8; alkylated DNA repair protein alkB homolog 8
MKLRRNIRWWAIVCVWIVLAFYLCRYFGIMNRSQSSTTSSSQPSITPNRSLRYLRNRTSYLVPCDCAQGTSSSYHACIQALGLVEVPGLYVQRGFISRAEQERLLVKLNRERWLPYSGKSVLEYGFNKPFYGTDITDVKVPTFLQTIGERLYNEGVLHHIPRYILINRYEIGQGIHPHSDDPMYIEGVVSLSLEADAVLRFREEKDTSNPSKTRKCGAVLLERGSVFVMYGQARYKWEHEMTPDTADLWEGNVVRRQRRTAITFRGLKPEIISGAKTSRDLIEEWDRNGRIYNNEGMD